MAESLDEQVLSSILKTFYTVFPHGAIFTGLHDQELLMIGALEPTSFNFAKLQALSHNQHLEKLLAGVPISNGYQAVAQFAMDREAVLGLTRGAAINTDRNAYAEVRQSRLFYEKENLIPNAFILRNFDADYSKVVHGVAFDWNFYLGILSSLEPDFYKYHALLQKLAAAPQQPADADLVLGRYLMQAERYASAYERLQSSMKKRATGETLNLMLEASMKTGETARALADCQR